jgi:uncharacterized protein YecT (DUF1311 family)
MANKILALSVFILSQSFLSAPAFAEKTIDECEKVSSTQKKLSRCFDTLSSGLDRELQTWVNNHVFNLEEKALLTGRHAALKMFKRSQNDFITFRDNDCRWQYLAISPSKGADLAYKKCYIIITKNRISELSKVP